MRYKMKPDVQSIQLSPSEVRKMQLNILEILIEFDRICRKHNIRYSLDGGTFLGAVRHNGFIPWDPDADVVILRKDYIRFKKICEQELKHSHFFLQDYQTDPYYRWGYARLLRKETEYVRAGHEHLKSKNGVFLDIFTLDSVPDSQIGRVLHKFTCFIIRKTLWSEVGKVVHPNAFFRLLYKVLSIIDRDKVFAFRNKIASICNKNDQSILVRHMCSPHPKKHSYGFPRDLFRSLSEYEFEGHKFLGFTDYDWYLTSIYGDYMSLPPVEDRTSHIPCSSYKFIEPSLLSKTD